MRFANALVRAARLAAWSAKPQDRAAILANNSIACFMA